MLISILTPTNRPRKRILPIIFASLALAFPSTAFAGNGEEKLVCDTVSIRFQVSKTELRPDFFDNSSAILKMRERYDLQNNDSTWRLKNVEIYGAASPEGSVELNNRLSRGRAASLMEYVRMFAIIPDSLSSFHMPGADWEGLLALVEKDPAVPNRDVIMEQLHLIIGEINNPGSSAIDGDRKLRRSAGAAGYSYLLKHLYPRLRAARMCLTWQWVPVPQLEQVTRIVTEVAPYTLPVSAPVFVPDRISVVAEEKPPFYLDLRTNMIYDALAVPNIGLDVYLGSNWSVGVFWMYGWWKCDHRHRYWRTYGGDVSVRRWFGSAAVGKPLTGHHVGAYFGIMTYDFEWGGKGYMGGEPGGSLWDRMNWYGGIDYGYSLPIGRRLNIDFSIGIGYLGGRYYEYKPIDNHYVWQTTKNRHYFGPTKAEISLVWLLGRGNFNARKGGDK